MSNLKTGQYYIKQMSESDAIELRDEYIRQNSENDFIDYLNKHFNSIQDFFEESIFIIKSKNGYDYWIETFNKYE